jgi:hypothetical protein
MFVTKRKFNKELIELYDLLITFATSVYGGIESTKELTAINRKSINELTNWVKELQAKQPKKNKGK